MKTPLPFFLLLAAAVPAFSENDALSAEAARLLADLEKSDSEKR